MENPECLYSLSFGPIFKKSCVENIMKYLSLDSDLYVLDVYIKLLRIAAALLTPSVIRILNDSRISGIVQQDWKITRVTPVYDDKRDRSNYRPTSVLGSINMIMERNDHSQILSYFIKHNLIIIYQFAFLKKTLPQDVSIVWLMITMKPWTRVNLLWWFLLTSKSALTPSIM